MSDDSPRGYAFGPLELDLERHLLLRDGEPVPLKPKVFDLLRLFVENPGRLITKGELQDALWQEQFVEESNLTQSVYELRKALGGSGRLITNVPRRGYRFDAEVTPRPAKPDQRPRRIETIAVLPFTALAQDEPDPSLEFGIAETLITALSRVASLVVRPAGSIRKFAGEISDPVSAGRELEVDAIVSGSIQRAGERLRVAARLVRTADGSIIWAGTIDEPFTDIFDVQDSICERLVQALALEIPGGVGRLLPRHTADPEAHRLFLRCRYHWHKWTPEHWMRAIEYGAEAVARDPRHAPSYSWMAAAHTALAITGVARPRDAFREAKRLVGKALSIDPSLSEVHEVKAAIALFHDWDWIAAETSLEAAITLNPSNAEARDLRALLRIVQGRAAEAIDEVLLAREIDPLSLLVNTDVGYVHYHARRFDEAIAQFRHTLELDRWFAHARYGLGYAYLAVGDHRAAIEAMESAIEHSGVDRETSPHLAYALALAGEGDRARSILAALGEQASSAFVDPYFQALICIGLGSTDEAFAFLDRAVDERSRELVYLRSSPIFDPVRSDGRSTGLLRRIGI